MASTSSGKSPVISKCLRLYLISQLLVDVPSYIKEWKTKNNDTQRWTSRINGSDPSVNIQHHEAGAGVDTEEDSSKWSEAGRLPLHQTWTPGSPLIISSGVRLACLENPHSVSKEERMEAREEIYRTWWWRTCRWFLWQKKWEEMETWESLLRLKRGVF